MSSNIESTVQNDIDWIEEAIAKNYFKYYEYNNFSNIEEIGSGSFGKVYRANWKSPYQYFALKSLFNIDEVGIKELVHEVIISCKIYLHTMEFSSIYA